MITSAEKFKQSAVQEVEIPGNEPGEVFTVKLKKVSILAIAGKGRIPNSLMSVVNKLFGMGGKATNDEVTEASMQHITQMAELLHIIARESMVEPTYDEVGEYLTDDQLEAVFSFTQDGVKKLESFPKQ